LKFKLEYDTTNTKYMLNIEHSTDDYIIIPSLLEQHVHYPIPEELFDAITEILLIEVQKIDKTLIETNYFKLTTHMNETITTVGQFSIYIKYKNEINDILNQTRKDFNKVIIEKCKELEVLYPEYYI